MKSKTKKTIPLIATGLVPAWALTSALAPSPALGATGDLDPGFGDIGRLGPILDGPAWSLEPLDDGSMLLGGGTLSNYYWYYYNAYVTNFVGWVTDAGAVAGVAALDNFQVFDVVRQSNGQVVAVGRTLVPDGDRSQFAAFRLQADGALDTTFGSGGVLTLPVLGQEDWDGGMSAVLDPDGRIVIAGSRAGRLNVLRLLPDGSVDNAFGSSGIFTGPTTYDPPGGWWGFRRGRTTLLRTAAGGYRVTVSNAVGCQILALTSVGAIDATFGTSGVVTAESPVGPSSYCSSMTSQPDGRLLVAGRADGLGFAERLLVNGQQDTSFSANVVSAAMTEATAIATGIDGSVVVAGTGVSGATIMRLQADGELDALFGRGGSTLIDIRSDAGSASVVHDMVVRADGSVLAAGGDDRSQRAFVARLLGVGGGASPGVVGITEQSVIETAEGRGEIVVNVRRTGGADGSVSVAYQTVANGDAIAGEDFGDVSGLLTWGDGDMSEQQIRVPIMSDDSAEGSEGFRVTLSDSQDGAGLGTSGVEVIIAADGGPFGQLSFDKSLYFATESGPAQVTVVRDYYSTGVVSVTVALIADTATAGEDFVASPITLTWADGEVGEKVAEIPIVDDALEEATETFKVRLSNPAGGAVLGQRSNARVEIWISDRPSASGGGAVGFLSLLLLGLLRTMRRITGGGRRVAG